jgi:hypothetical protein
VRQSRLYLRSGPAVRTRFREPWPAEPEPVPWMAIQSVLLVVVITVVLSAGMTFLALTLLGIQHQLTIIEQLIATQPAPLY